MKFKILRTHLETPIMVTPIFYCFYFSIPTSRDGHFRIVGYSGMISNS